MNDRLEPVDVTVDRAVGLVITFADDVVAEFNLMELRLSCPCATCRVLREQGEETWPRPGSPVPLRIEDASFHGAWGLKVIWNDGHATGIYPFDLLRQWSDTRSQ